MLLGSCKKEENIRPEIKYNTGNYLAVKLTNTCGYTNYIFLDSVQHWVFSYEKGTKDTIWNKTSILPYTHTFQTDSTIITYIQYTSSDTISLNVPLN
jgi:hypothetical protein